MIYLIIAVAINITCFVCGVLYEIYQIRVKKNYTEDIKEAKILYGIYYPKKWNKFIKKKLKKRRKCKRNGSSILDKGKAVISD
ncbi:MAG: hypothetical protein QM689_08690 [Oscillospiraceae bacterium]